MLEGYTLLDYIESDGTQYIDTGVGSFYNMFLDVQFLARSNRSLMGNYAAAGWYFGITVDGYYELGPSVISSISGLERRTIHIDSTQSSIILTADGETISREKISVPAMNLKLFGGDSGSDLDRYMCSAKIFGCQIYVDNDLVRDYVPVMNLSGSIGLYDKVNDVFYPSATGTNFVGKMAGSILPIGYTECEYIESNGTQYVDANFKPNNSSKVEIGVVSSQSTGGNVWLFGSQTGWGNNGYAVSTYTAEFGSITTTTGINFHDGIKHDVVFDKGVLFSDGKTIWSASSGSFQTEYNMYIASINSSGTVSGFVGRVYYCRIYENDILVRDYIPCQTDDGIYGLYDKVNDVFYGSSTESQFTGKWKESKNLKVSMQEFRMRLMTKNAQGLPKGYFACEYIESNGSNYIDTGFVPNQDTRVVIDVLPLSESTGFIFGASTGQKINSFCCVVYNSNIRSDYGSTQLSLNVDILNRMTIDKNKNVTTINGTSQTSEYSTFSAGTSLVLFATNTNGNVETYCKGRIYSCKIYNNATLVRDYIPCVNTEGYFGLYDKESKTFYKTATSSEFFGKVILPDGYSWMESIYGNGNNYIDTGFKPNQDTRVVMDAQFVNADSISNLYCFFGCRGNSKYYEIYKASASKWNLFYFYGTEYSQSFTIDYSARHYIDYNKNKASIDGVSLTYTAANFQMDYNLYLAADNSEGSMESCSPMRIFYCQIFDNGKFERFFVPCINESGTIGMLDVVNNIFYESSGTPFGQEPVVSDYTYTGGIQEVVLDAGTYVIETWGASGGNSTSVKGGLGGYSVGTLSISSSMQVYIVIGGAGFNDTGSSVGGYNGGGNGGSGAVNYGASRRGCGGGGATHVAQSTGTLDTLSSNKTSVIIVAGGGGGASGASQGGSSSARNEYCVRGGHGGGSQGTEGSNYKNGENHNVAALSGGGGGAGSQTGGGSRGMGRAELGATSEDDDYSGSGGGGGGGGYYGGGGGAGGGTSGGGNDYSGGNGSAGSFGKGGVGGSGDNDSSAYYGGVGGGGGGGSGYVSALLSAASTKAGNVSFPSVTGGSETGHSGNGYCRITKIK